MELSHFTFTLAWCPTDSSLATYMHKLFSNLKEANTFVENAVNRQLELRVFTARADESSHVGYDARLRVHEAFGEPLQEKMSVD